MVLNKKRVFLYSSILLLILIGVYFVNSIGVVNRNQLSTQVNATTETNGTQSGCTAGSTSAALCSAPFSDLINWTRGGGTELFVFKINISGGLSATANNNVTRINITLPTGFGSPVRQGQAAATANASFQRSVGGIPNTNASWTINTTATYVTVFNETSTGTAAATDAPIMGVGIASETIFIYFNATAGNGTERVVNWTVAVYNSTGGAEGTGIIDSGLGLLTGIDGLPPRANTTNVTDSVNTRSSFSGTQYLKYEPNQAQQGVNITLSLTDYNIDKVLLVYNSTGGSINFQVLRNLLYNTSFYRGNLTGISIGGEGRNFTITENAFIGTGDSPKANFTPLDTRSRLNPTATEYIFRFNISNSTWGLGASDGTTFKYVFVVYDLYNNSEIINNSNAEYVLARDIANPTVTLTAPTDTTITVSNSIKYTCDGTDTSGLASCSLKLTKPGGSTVTKTGCGTEQTFTLTDTNEAGTNTVECTLTDNVGHTASTSKTFSVSAATTGGGVGGGVGGGGAGSSPENPVTVQLGESIDAGTLSTTETYTSVAKEGTVTFTVAGGSHSVKVLGLTTDSVTIEISSTPKQVTLTLGETKGVDVNDDGTDDLSVTLKSITNEKADLVFKALEVSTLPTEGEQPATGEGEQPGVVTGEEAKPSLTWLWILIIVVVIVVIFMLTKKKR